MPYTLHFVHVFAAPPERVYRAHIDPAALAKWNAPDGFTCEVHEMNATVGGGYRMTFTNFSANQGHSFGGRYLEVVPNEKLVVTDQFDDPSLPGTMITTTTFKAVGSGCEVHIEQAGLPDVVPADGCRMGWQQSLANLAKLVEPNIPAE